MSVRADNTEFVKVDGIECLLVRADKTEFVKVNSIVCSPGQKAESVHRADRTECQSG